MSRVTVEFDVELPVTKVSGQQIDEWLRFELHDNGSISADNPLSDYEVEPIEGTFQWR